MENSPQDPNQEVFEVAGEPLDEGDRFWIKIVEEMTAGNIEAIEEGAKQIITTACLLQGVYFAGISLSDIKRNISLSLDWYFILLLLAPPIFWSISCVFAIQVFNPRKKPTNLRSPKYCQSCYESIVRDMGSQLKRARWILVLGFIPFIIAIFVFLQFMPIVPK